MALIEVVGQTLVVDDDGFFVDSEQWTPDIAEALALQLGIPELTERHWRVLTVSREAAARDGQSPDSTRLARLTGLGAAELQGLFPGDVGATVARVAGIPRPALHI